MKSEWKFTDTVLKTITRYCNYVTVLDISDCNRVTDEGVALSLQACPRLIKLRLARLHSILLQDGDELCVGFTCFKFQQVYFFCYLINHSTWFKFK